MMLVIPITHRSTITRKTVTVNSEISYQMNLELDRRRSRPFILTILVSTLFGQKRLFRESYLTLGAAHQQLTSYLNNMPATSAHY